MESRPRQHRKSSVAEREFERKKRRQEMYLDAMDDLTILRDHYKSEVRKKLKVKVQKQRKEREDKKALEKAQEKERIEKHKSKQRFEVHLPKSKSAEDTDFLEKLTFSKFYLAIAIRNHLEKHGELDKKYKVDEFEKIIAMPGVLAKVQLEITKGNKITLKGLKSIVSKDGNHKAELPLRDGPRPLSTIADEQETISRIETLDGKREKLKAKKSGDLNSSSLEDLFPSIPYPKLPMINTNLDNPELDEEKVQLRERYDKRKKKLEKQKWMLEKMYQRSQAYETATGRLLTKYEQSNNSSELREDFSPKDIVALPMQIISDSHSQASSTSSKETEIPNSFKELPDETNTNRFIYDYLDSLDNLHISNRQMLSNIEERSELDERPLRYDRPLSYETSVSLQISNDSQWKGRAYSDEVIRKKMLGIEEPKSEPTEAIPLTINALEEVAPVKIVTGPPSLWINPL